MYGNLFVNTQISTNLRNKLQEYTQSPDKITQKYERIHSFTKRTVRSFRKFEVRVDRPLKTEWALDQSVANSTFQMLNYPNVDLSVTNFHCMYPQFWTIMP